MMTDKIEKFKETYAARLGEVHEQLRKDALKLVSEGDRETAGEIDNFLIDLLSSWVTAIWPHPQAALHASIDVAHAVSGIVVTQKQPSDEAEHGNDT